MKITLKYVVCLPVILVACRKASNQSINPIDCSNNNGTDQLSNSNSEFVNISIGFEEQLAKKGYIDDGLVDGVVELKKILKIDTLKLQSHMYENYGFDSINGIEYFQNLRYLDISGSYIDSLNLSNNFCLEFLNCSGIMDGAGINATIKYLNIENCRKLTYLNCYWNLLSSLDVSSCIYLKELHCGGNDLMTLNLEKNSFLEVLSISGNKRIENLNLKSNHLLRELYCSVNSLISLDIKHLSKLIKLDCSLNSNISMGTFDKLDISQNVELKELNIQGINIRSLDLSRNPKIEFLDISLCKYIHEIDLKNLSQLKGFQCAYTNLDKINLSSNLMILFLNISGSIFNQIDLTHNRELETLISYQNNHIEELDLRECRKIKKCLTFSSPNLKTICVHKLPEISDSNWIKDDWTEYRICNY